jgi:hypothetical protein
MLHLSSVFVCLVVSYTGFLFSVRSVTNKGHIHILCQQTYSLKVFKHSIQSQLFFSPQNAMYFMLHFLVHKLFTFYTKDTLQLKVQFCHQRGK